jgi:hypothetical protein
MISRLTKLGLVYFDDFFEFSGDYPSWCVFRGSCDRPSLISWQTASARMQR